MAESNALRGRPTRYPTQVDHPRNRITVQEWQVIGRALEIVFGQKLEELVRGGFFSDRILEGLKPGDTTHLRRKIGLHMGMAMVEEYDAEFPGSRFSSRIHERYLAKSAAGHDEDVISVDGRLLRFGNTFVIQDQCHPANGLLCTLLEAKIGSSTGRVDVHQYHMQMDCTLANLYEVRF